MTWSDKMAELGEILYAVSGAFVVLLIVGWLVDVTGRKRREEMRSGDATPLSPTAPPATGQAAPANTTVGNPPMIARIFITNEAAAPMRPTPAIDVIAGSGIVNDRYGQDKGHWSHTDDCEVTMIAQEDIDAISLTHDVRIQNGEHRRNIVTRNVALDDLIGKRFRIGTAFFGYDCPRPPCAYIQLLTQPGMAKALGKRAGICVRCIQSGTIKEGDVIEIFQTTPLQALQQYLRGRFGRKGNVQHG